MVPVKKIFILFTFLACLTITGFTQDGQVVKKSIISENIDGKDYYLHFVKKGETLFAIARAYGITVDDIFRSNPESREGISSGRILKIPYEKEKQKESNQEQSNTQDEYFYHIVKKKETLYGISKKYGAGIDKILELNPEMGDYPREGQTLKIPVVKSDNVSVPIAAGENTIKHSIVLGETLYGIAKKYNVTIGEIKNANQGLLDIIKPGTEILIPNQDKLSEEVNATEEKNENDLIEHEVVAGETLYSIAKTYAVSIDSLRAYNHVLTTNLKIGQLIFIPPANNEFEFIVHKADKKQTLEGISKLYGIEVEKLKNINPGVKRKTKKGQFIKIPVEPREEAVVVNAAEEATDNPLELNHCFNSEHFKQSTYNIALMLPFFLEEMDSIDFSNEKDFARLANLVSFRFLDFYGGFRMAVDSMKAQGMNLNLFVYDVDNDVVKTNEVLLSSELSSMDLIVGPLFAKSFTRVADFAKTYEIPIVNPLSERDEIIYNNPWVYKIQPSSEKQIDQLVSYLEIAFPESNILLSRHNKYKFQSEVSYIRNSLNTKRPGHIYVPNNEILDIIDSKKNASSLFTENKMVEKTFLKDNIGDSTYFTNLVKEVIYTNDSTTGLSMNLSEVRHNVVIAFSEDIVFSKELLTQLNKLGQERDITLIGLPDWNEFTGLETSQLLNLDFHCFTSRAVNFNNTRIQSWVLNYRDIYNTEPAVDNYAFDGFDVGWYFLNALYNYGKNFGDCLQYLTVPLIQTKYNFESKPSNGFQNIHWNLGKYADYQFIKLQYEIE